jgi:hypothetical protein
MSLFARLALFHTRGEVFSGLHPFEVCIIKTRRLFASKSFMRHLTSLHDSKRKDCFLKRYFLSTWGL